MISEEAGSGGFPGKILSHYSLSETHWPPIKCLKLPTDTLTKFLTLGLWILLRSKSRNWRMLFPLHLHRADVEWSLELREVLVSKALSVCKGQDTLGKDSGVFSGHAGHKVSL